MSVLTPIVTASTPDPGVRALLSRLGNAYPVRIAPADDGRVTLFVHREHAPGVHLYGLRADGKKDPQTPWHRKVWLRQRGSGQRGKLTAVVINLNVWSLALAQQVASWLPPNATRLLGPYLLALAHAAARETGATAARGGGVPRPLPAAVFFNLPNDKRSVDVVAAAALAVIPANGVVRAVWPICPLPHATVRHIIDRPGGVYVDNVRLRDASENFLHVPLHPVPRGGELQFSHLRAGPRGERVDASGLPCDVGGGWPPGQEDPRLVYLPGHGWYAVCNAYSAHHNRQCYLVCLSQGDEVPGRAAHLHVPGETVGRVQKNWSPLVRHGVLHFVYSIWPKLAVLRCPDPSTGICTVVCGGKLPTRVGAVHGGTPWVCLAEPLYVSFCNRRTGNRYRPVLCVLDAIAWRVVYISTPLDHLPTPSGPPPVNLALPGCTDVQFAYDLALDTDTSGRMRGRLRLCWMDCRTLEYDLDMAALFCVATGAQVAAPQSPRLRPRSLEKLFRGGGVSNRAPVRLDIHSR